MRLIIVTFVVLVVCFGTAVGQDVWVSSFDGAWDLGTKVRTGRPVTWTISINNPAGGLMSNTNGFAVYLSSDGTPFGLLYPGPGFMPITYNTLADFSNYATYAQIPFGIDGFGIDTIGFAGVSFGLPAEINGPTWTITTMVDTSLIGYYLCLDTTFFPPGGIWFWGIDGGSVIPSWDGPHCYQIAKKDICCLSSGDVNWDNRVLVDDLVYLVNYLFKDGPPTPCLEAGDVNLDYRILVNDLTFLVDYLFKSGPPPPPCY